jgi:predicted restriction endonuclease
MTPHCNIYFKYFDIGEQDMVTCECCMKQGRADGQNFDLHHIEGRGIGMNTIQNIMCLCRKHHLMTHDSKISKSELQYIHNNYLQGHRKIFLK